MDASDYTTSNTNTVTLVSAANLNDIITVVALQTDIPNRDYVPISGGTFTGDVTHSGDVTFSGSVTHSGSITGSGVGMFRRNAQTLSTNVTIAATENSVVGGPITVADGVTLTVTTGGNLAIV